MKKMISMLLVAAMLLSMMLLAGCGETKKTEDKNETIMALVVAGSFGDRSFYDSSKEGAERLEKELGIKVSYIECNNEAHSTQMQNAADKSDIVVCVGWEFEEISNIAPQYPKVKWIWIDNATEEPVANLLNITYAQNEGSFLAGYIAAAMSKTGTVGAVGGEDSATINDFIVGYEQGAKHYGAEVGKEIHVVKNYTGTYDDPTAGKNCAIALNEQSADVIFQIASAAGDGVFEAARERDFYAIGVDSDQKYIADDVIICSMKKEVGNSIYEAVKKFVSGDTSALGTTWVAGLEDGYVSIGYGEEGSTQQVSDEIKAAVEALAAQIGKSITVETTR